MENAANQSNNLSLPSFVTVRQANAFMSELDSFMQTLFRSGKNNFQNSLKSVSQTHAEWISRSLNDNKIKTDDVERIKQFLASVKQQIGSLKVIRLTLAFDPSVKTIEKTHRFITENIGIGYILEIETMRNILGGATITYNGQYKDYSVKKTLDQVFVNKIDLLTN